MADTLSTQITATVGWDYESPIDLSTVKDISSLAYSLTMASGTAANQADKIWSDQRTVTASGNDDLVLSAMTNTVFGSTVTIAMVKVRGILIVNTSTTSGDNLLVGGAATHEWSAAFGASGNKIYCPAGSSLLLTNSVAGWAVTSGSADQLRIHNSGSNSITYQIVILGTSA